MKTKRKALAIFASFLTGMFFLIARSNAAEPGIAEEPPPLTVDLHVDLPWQVHFRGRDPRVMGGQAGMDALKKGSVGGLILPIYLPDSLNNGTGATILDAEHVLSTIRGLVAENPELLPLERQAAAPGKVTTWLSIEGAGAFAEAPAKIDEFIERGVRIIGLVHGRNNQFASSATGDPTDEGLTPLGKKFCARVYERGALIDVSHLSDAGFAALVPLAQRASAPLVATHSNARALADHPRNLTDSQIQAIAASGGVVGANFHGAFVIRGRRASLRDVANQIEYMVHLAGIDHVSIGSDFEGGIRPAEGLEDASRLPALADLLRSHGMNEADLQKLFSLNALRVLGYRSKEQLRASLKKNANATQSQ